MDYATQQAIYSGHTEYGKRSVRRLEWPGRKTEQLGSMNDLSGPIGYSAAVFMKAVGQKARAKEFKFYN